MKANQRQGDTLDEELDFYRDDDDVAVLFLMPDGSKSWILGNIEEVAAAKGTVDPRRAMAANSSSYLLGLDKEYKSRGVFLDDPKGLFILRWYKEVDKDGNELAGYQNANCFAYKLMANNDGDTFAWTSNIQLISKVYLKKHTSMGRTYTLNKQDYKMVNDTMKKKQKP